MKLHHSQFGESKMSAIRSFINLFPAGSAFVLIILLMIGILSGCSGEASFSGGTFNFPGWGFPNDYTLEWVLPEQVGWSSDELKLSFEKELLPVNELVCYCFDYSMEDIRRDVIANGRSLIMEEIKAAKQFGGCQCAVKNPKGR